MGLIKTLRNIRNGVISAIPLLPNYTQTQYVDDNLPALESKNLNKAEKQLVTLTNQINANIGTLNTLIATSNINVDKVQKLNSNGDFNQDLSMNTKKIYNLAPPTNNLDAVNKSYSDSFSFRKQGYNAGGNRIQNLGTPINDTDAATVQYVKDNSGGEPTRVVMYNETITINNNGVKYINMIATGINKDFKNIHITLDCGDVKWNVNKFFYDLIFPNNVEVLSLDYNQNRYFSRILINNADSDIAILNYTNANRSYTFKVTGERITTTKKENKKSISI